MIHGLDTGFDFFSEFAKILFADHGIPDETKP